MKSFLLAFLQIPPRLWLCCKVMSKKWFGLMIWQKPPAPLRREPSAFRARATDRRAAEIILTAARGT
jgi:hypothetical protein